MINKFIKIQGVGKFKNFIATEDISFVRNNIIYAENGYGKTTLTSILNSYAQNKPELITKRKTIGIKNQEIELLINNKKYRFFNGNWSDNVIDDDIEIFDTFFVNNNIFSGFEFSLEHRKNLYNFIFGKESIKLNNEISEIKYQIENQAKILKELENTIQNQINKFNFSVFLKLQQDYEIEKKIESKQREFEVAQKENEISKKENLSNLSGLPLKIDYLAIKEIIKSTIQTISEAYLKIVETQINKINQSISEPNDWLKKGVKFYTDSNKDSPNCPFCQQSIKNNQLIEAYTNYFTDEYKKIETLLIKFITDLNKLKSDLASQNYLLIHSKNTHSLDFWNNYFESKIELPHPPDSNILLTNIDEIIRLLQHKKENLFISLPTERIDFFQNLYAEHIKNIEKYNFITNEINFNIKNIKSKIIPFEEIKKEVEILNLIKIRFKDDIVKLCNEYKKVWIAHNDNTKEKADKQKQLYDFSTKFISFYGDKINYYLKKFNNSFTIKKISSGYVSTSKLASVNYEIQFMNQNISFNENSTENSVKYTLSESDKSSLAFSFFLAKLELDNNLKSKTLIIDDSISSFDKNRRNQTISIISQFSQKVEQIIMLTHDQNFCFDLYTNTRFNPKPFLIDYNGNIREYENIKNDIELERKEKIT